VKRLGGGAIELESAVGKQLDGCPLGKQLKEADSRWGKDQGRKTAWLGEKNETGHTVNNSMNKSEKSVPGGGGGRRGSREVGGGGCP